MLIATESFDLDGNEIRAGITRCSPDAEAIQRYPEKFRDDPDGPPPAQPRYGRRCAPMIATAARPGIACRWPRSYASAASA